MSLWGEYFCQPQWSPKNTFVCHNDPQRILLSATMIPKEYFCLPQWFPKNTFVCHNDLQIWCEMRKVTLKRTHDSIMGALPASNPLTLVGFVQLYFNFVQLYLCAKFCSNLWLWLILCKQPIKPAPSNSASRAEQQTIASSSHNVNKCITHCASLHPQTIASQCIWTIVSRRYLHSIWEDCLRARRSLLIKFVCTARTIADCLFPIANCPQSSCLTWQRQVHSWCNFGKYFATGYRIPVWFDY